MITHRQSESDTDITQILRYYTDSLSQALHPKAIYGNSCLEFGGVGTLSSDPPDNRRRTRTQNYRNESCTGLPAQTNQVREGVKPTVTAVSFKPLAALELPERKNLDRENEAPVSDLFSGSRPSDAKSAQSLFITTPLCEYPGSVTLHASQAQVCVPRERETERAREILSRTRQACAFACQRALLTSSVTLERGLLTWCTLAIPQGSSASGARQ